MNELTPGRERMLEECLLLLDGGASVEDCLSLYPDAADALRPFLEMRATLTTARQFNPPPGAYEQGLSRLLSQVEAQPTVPAQDSFWSRITRFFSGEQHWAGGLARAAVAIVALFALGLGGLSASAAGGFEPAQEALRPARNVLMRIIPGRDRPDRRAPIDRPTPGATDVPVIDEGAREPTRETPRPTSCIRSSDRVCLDEARPTPTPPRDVGATDGPIRDGRPTTTYKPDAPASATPLRDGPATATPRRDAPATVTPIRRVLPTATPVRDPQPTATSVRDMLPTATPVRIAPATATPVRDPQPTATPLRDPSPTATSVRDQLATATPIRTEPTATPTFILLPPFTPILIVLPTATPVFQFLPLPITGVETQSGR